MSDLSELTRMSGDANKAFHEFKKANDARIEELKKGGTVPADLLAKIDAVAKDFGEQKKLIEIMEAKMKRPNFGAGGGSSVVIIGGREIKGYVEDETQAEHRKLFQSY